MDFRLLGSLQVFDGGLEIGVSGGKQRALLALLLVHANHAVSEDCLIEALWGENASPKAGSNLHVLVSRLRGSIGAERVAREAGGYLIRVEDGELDVDRFERLRHEQRFEDALALWRGPPLADFVYEDWAVNEIGRLEDLRLLALEERIDVDLAAGQHAELVGELRSLVAEHPLRETLRRHLIVALYRSGRQAEALEAYRDARRMLDEELGLVPSPALRELEAAVLRQDPELDAPSRMRAIVPVGRRRRRVLVAALAALLGFAGAASAVVLVQRGGERQAAAATAEDRPKTTSSSRGRATAPTTARKVVHRAGRAKPKDSRSRTETRTPPPPPATAPAPPPPPAPPPTPGISTRTKPAAPGRAPTTQPPPPAPQPPAVDQTRIADDFDDGVINRTIWQWSSTNGVTVQEVNGRVEMTIAPSAVGGGEYNLITGSLGTTCRYLGDFDVRVDYQLLDWPAANGVIGQLSSWYNAYAASIGRLSNNLGREEYAGWFPGPTANHITTAHSTGTLRIVRDGSETFASYRSSGRWESVIAARVSGSPIIGLQIMSRDDAFADKSVRVAFDNFVLLADQPVC